MSEDVIMTLLQFVALALPAVGIYLQVLRDLHKPDPQDEIPIDSTNHMMDYNLAKIGIFVITISGILDIAYLFIVHTPSMGTGLGSVVLPLILVTSLLFIGFGLFLFAGSVYFSFGFPMRVGQNPSIQKILSSYFRCLYRRFHPKESLGPDGEPQPLPREDFE